MTEHEVDRKLREFEERRKKNARIIAEDDENFTAKIPKAELLTKLSQENEDLKLQLDDRESKLSIIAEQEFSRRKAEVETRAKELGLTVNLETPQDLKALEKIIQENSRSNTGNRDIPLSHAYGQRQEINQETDPFEVSKTKSIKEVDFENREQLITTLQKISGTHTHPRKSEADQILSKMYQRLDTTSININRERDLDKGIPQTDPEEWKQVMQKVKQVLDKRGAK